MGKLTAKQIENLTVPKSYVDGNGLMLVVRANGSKSWILRYQIDGRRRDMGIGPYPEISLKEARLLAADQKGLLLKGVDPIAAREETIAEKQALKEAEEASKVSFAVVAEEYIDAHKVKWKTKTDKPSKTEMQWRSSLATYAYPYIGNTAPADITTEDILKVLKPIWYTKPETAYRVRTRMELILDAAKSRKLRSGENPARWRGHLSLLLPERAKVKAVVNHSSLSWRRLQEFMAVLAKHDDLSAKALTFAILTAGRTSEVLHAVWQEFDLDEAVWTVPAIRMKAEREHRIPLSPQAVNLLKQLPRHPENTYVFPSIQRGKHLSDMAMLMKVRAMDETSLATGGAGWRDQNGRVVVPHGFRSTFRDWAAEQTNHSRELIELSLAHVVAQGAEAAYWRSDLLDKRRGLMNDWGDFVLAKKPL